MAYTEKDLILEQASAKTTVIDQTTAGANAVKYTNPASITTVISRIILNLIASETTTRTVTICKVPDSAAAVGTKSANDELFSNVEVRTGDPVIIDPAIVLEDENDTIQVYADSASKANVFMYGFTK